MTDVNGTYSIHGDRARGPGGAPFDGCRASEAWHGARGAGSGVRAGYAEAGARMRAATAPLTRPAALLAAMIERMGGAATSHAKGTYVNLSV